MKKKYLKQLIEGIEKDILNNKIQVWIYQREVENPTHIGLEQAKEYVNIYKKRVENLEANLIVYKLYAKENKL